MQRALAAAADDATTNAFLELHEEAAVSAPARSGPLAGVPVAVKDLIDHRGHMTTAGSAFFRRRATATAPALDRVERAGAVVIGRTNLHEFAFGFSSENPWFGPVRNPWDPDLSAGGSSGGSAAAVASGVVPIALGTDTGGSIRVPAALCGVTGLKVTHGLIPLEGVFPLVPTLDTVGAIAADLDDLERVTRVMAGADWPVANHPNPTAPRLVVPEAWLDTAPMSRAVSATFEEFLDGARRAGISVERRPLPLLAPSPHQAAVIGVEAAAVHGDWRRSGKPYGDEVGSRVDAAIAVADDREAIEEAGRWRLDITRTLRAATADGGVIVTPTVASMDKRIGEDRIGEHHYRTVLSWFSAPVNVTGCPALTVPVAGPGRRPGVQLIGDHHTEPYLVAVARHLEDLGLIGINRWSSE